jgi:hypothetical protein
LASFEVVEQVHAQQACYKGTATHNECGYGQEQLETEDAVAQQIQLKNNIFL